MEEANSEWNTLPKEEKNVIPKYKYVGKYLHEHKNQNPTYILKFDKALLYMNGAIMYDFINRNVQKEFLSNEYIIKIISLAKIVFYKRIDHYVLNKTYVFNVYLKSRVFKHKIKNVVFECLIVG
ncbi:MAG: hypothetical protein QXJ62_07720 [Nitrososphaeria archaeon]